MKLIGTSFGGCLKSILDGKVSENDVLLIIARTKASTLESMLDVARTYYNDGNRFVKKSELYWISDTVSLQQVEELTRRLYITGKIHQPRLFDNFNFEHWPELFNDLWIELVPTNTNSTPAVVIAYENYKLLNLLTQ